MAANGISTRTGANPVATKILRRTEKLTLAATKRSDNTKPGYRVLNNITGTHTAYVNGTGGAQLATLSGSKSNVDGSPWAAAPANGGTSGSVDASGFFEQQLIGGTYIAFDQSISGQHVVAICTNFNGNPTHGSYIKVNGTVVASDYSVAPDGTDNSVGGGVGTRMTRGHTVVIINSSGSIISKTVYDTYGTPSLCNNMATALRAMPAGTIVAIGTYDATSCTQALRDAFTNYFNDIDYTNTWNSQRRSQMFLGKRNGTS